MAASTTKRTSAAGRTLAVDRLPDVAVPLQVLRFDGVDIGVDGGPRDPHRHDYHELLWTRTGQGVHLIDGEPLEVRPRSVTLIGRGQVHVFERGCNLVGSVLRFGDDLIHAGPGERSSPSWLLAGRGGLVVDVPAGEMQALEAAIDALGAEADRPADANSADVQRHLLMTVLLWVQRWYDAQRSEHRDADDSERQLHRRFAQLLEQDFARHHDAAHYADALAVPPKALSAALAQLTGRPTKELILDRVMLEAARLLRFTDLTIGQVSHQAGYEDQLYFSRAFKRHFGQSPSAFRDSVRGA